MKHALVRPISDQFEHATVRIVADRPPNVARARAQHAAYVDVLSALGLDVRALAPSPSPDGCFVEDQAVVIGDVALVTRSGHPGRRAEADDVEVALRRVLRTTRMAAPATLDGGDVLRVGGRLFVGVSDRTSVAGVAALSDTFSPLGLTVVEVEVRDALHLKCHATALDARTVLLAPSLVAPDGFPGLDIVEVSHDEAYAANVVAIGGDVLVASGFDGVASTLRDRGLRVHTLEMDEIARADGSLTCLSLLW